MLAPKFEGTIKASYVDGGDLSGGFGIGVGAAFGDGTYMRSNFGVPGSAAGSSPLAAFTPSGGLYGVDVGFDAMTALSRRWVVFGSMGVSQLRGDARRSPLTQRATNYGASLGVAYRYGR